MFNFRFSFTLQTAAEQVTDAAGQKGQENDTTYSKFPKRTSWLCGPVLISSIKVLEDGIIYTSGSSVYKLESVAPLEYSDYFTDCRRQSLAALEGMAIDVSPLGLLFALVFWRVLTMSVVQKMIRRVMVASSQSDDFTMLLYPFSRCLSGY